MAADERIGALEALLFIAAEPMPLAVLAEAVGASEAETDSMLRVLADELAHGPRPRGFQLREAGGGWRLYTNPKFADVLAAHVAAEHSGRLSAPAMETLAVVAYKQPVTRAQIAAIRGVSVDSVVRTLMARGLIGEVGTSAASGAVLYGTTPYFLEAMGMNSLEELQPLAPYLPDATELDDVAKELP
ncbi:MAG: SMC-Scp complex subunit ScpB [Actinomycetaceae bacterium]|nr:SMC-Scp complex subunit ScpB [Actinomycetaceae bacterium]